MTETERRVEINMSRIPVAGIGGLGLVAVAAAMAYVLPEAWWFLGFALIGGVLLGVVMVLIGRGKRPSSGPSGDDPAILLREPSSADGSEPQTERRTDVPDL